MNSKTKKSAVKKMRVWCDECYSEGELSDCCDAGAGDGRCELCGRFCSTHPCHNCEGSGYLEYRVGDEVLIFVCVWSPEHVQKLYNPKKVGDTKNFEGKIVDILDDQQIAVRVKYRKQPMIFNPEDLEVR